MGSIRFGWLVGIIGIILFMGCGPDTILVRPELDTPNHHTANGNILLERLKIEAAFQEFRRALELDPLYAPAHAGLALVQGRRGNYSAGLETLAKAKKMAKNDDEMQLVEKAYKQFNSYFTNQLQ